MRYVLQGLRDFLNEHFNVLILVFLFVGAGAVLLHVVHHTQDQVTLNWLEHVSDQILAALLGMMTGYRIAQATNPTPPPPLPSPISPAEPPKP
jgi:hypothetical protein